MKHKKQIKQKQNKNTDQPLLKVKPIQETNPVQKDIIITYSDYSRSATGFAAQMAALLPTLRKHFIVIEFAIGARMSMTNEELQKTGNVVIGTCDDNDNYLNGEYYAQSLLLQYLDSLIYDQRQIKCAFVNHDPQCLHYVGPIFKKHNIPLIQWCLHDNDYVANSTLGHMLNPDHIIYQTEYARRTIAIRATTFLDGPVIYPSIDVEPLRKVDPATALPPAIYSQVAKKIEGKKVVLFVGKNQARKNIACVLDAAKILAEKRPDLLFLIHSPEPRAIGSGGETLNEKYPELLNIEEYRRTIGLPQESILIIKDPLRREHLNAIYELANLFVMPSCSEGFGMIFLECFAKGIPIIATGYSASAEIVGNERGEMLNDYSLVYIPQRQTTWAYPGAAQLAESIDVLTNDSDQFSVNRRASMIDAQKKWMAEHTAFTQSNLILDFIKGVVKDYKKYQQPFPAMTVIV